MNRPLFAGDPEVWILVYGKKNFEKRYPDEPRARAVRMVLDHGSEYRSRSAAISSVSQKVGCSRDSLRIWIKQHETDSGLRGGITTAERDRIKELERENRQLRQANEILKKASAYFAQAEIVGGVRHHMPDTRQPFDQAACLRAVAPLTGRDREADRQAKCIHGGVYLGGQATLGATDCVSLSPPFAPLASAWALQMVASTKTYSKSGSALKVLKKLSQTPDSVQRRNRQCAVRQLPGTGGRSRHGEAVRANQRIASRKSRLSDPVRPRSPFLPGTSGSIRAHCASLKVRLLNIASVFDLESKFKAFGNPPNEDAT